MAIGKSSIKRAASVNSAAKDGNERQVVEAVKEVEAVNEVEAVKEVENIQEIDKVKRDIETTKTNKKPMTKKLITKTVVAKPENTLQSIENTAESLEYRVDELEEKLVIEKKKEIVSNIKSDLPIYLL